MQRINCVPLILIILTTTVAGQEWETYTKTNSGLTCDNVLALAASPGEEDIWFGMGYEQLAVGPGSAGRGLCHYQLSSEKWEAFNIEDGLIGDVVNAVVVDYFNVWIGTNKGASRYKINTKEFLTIHGLEEKTIHTVAECDSLVCFGTDVGLAIYSKDSQRLRWLSQTEGLLNNKIQSIAIENNLIWIGSNLGLQVYDHSEGTFVSALTQSVEGKSITALAIDLRYVWAGLQDGLYRLNQSTGIWELFSDMKKVSAIAYNNTNAWITTRGGGAHTYNYKTNNWENFYMEQGGLVSNYINGVCVLPSSIWFASDIGVIKYQPQFSPWTSFSSSDIGMIGYINSVGVDDKYVWFGGYGGICRYSKLTTRWEHFNVGSVIDLEVGIDDIWCGVNDDTIKKLDKETGQVMLSIAIGDNFFSPPIQCLALDGYECWVGTMSGIYRIIGGTKVLYDLEDYLVWGNGPACEDISAIAIGDKYIWFGPSTNPFQKIPRFERASGNWNNDIQSGSYVPDFQSIAITGDLVWFGTLGSVDMKGIYIYNKKTEQWEREFYYPGDILYNTVWSIVVDSIRNHIWFGTGVGAGRYDITRKQWQTFNKSDGLICNDVQDIGIDSLCVWFATGGEAFQGEGGISRFSDPYPPIIIHAPIIHPSPINQKITIEAEIRDNLEIVDPLLYYKRRSETQFGPLSMNYRFGKIWSVDIPGSDVMMEGIVYYIQAFDGYQCGYHPWRYPIVPPHHIKVFDNIGPEAKISLVPSGERDFILSDDDTIFVKGNVDGTFSVPEIVRIVLNQFNNLGMLINYFTLSKDAISLRGEGTVREIGDSLNVGSLNENTSSIELAITISESDSVQDKTFYSNRLTVLQDRNFPICVISQPTEGIEVGQVVPIIGTVYDAHLKEYKLEYGKGKKPTAWKSIPVIEFQPTVNIIDSLLGRWYTYELPDTIYSLRLNAWDYANHISKDSVWIIVNKKPILAGKGGEVFSSDGMVKAYIPPNALDKDTPIAIEPVKDIPQIDDSTLTPINICYEFRPSDLILSKPMTVTFYYTDESISDIKNKESLSSYHWNNKNSIWSNVGGTIDPTFNNLTVAFKEFGIYGVMKAISVSGGKLSISTVDCQPRLFSPRGGGHSAVTNISFHLGKDSKVTIKVFNMAGRLVNTLCENMFMTRGMNSIAWNGRDSSDRYCISGLYVVLIQAEEKNATEMVMVLNK